ncbi:hypothetical protein DT594_03400 [Halopseudomonas laoshanensis]|uniref:DNA repair protein n=1 Tax=Halopseudomonas laoshanensis TaxID=2268758 RepID=A0A7V7GWR4_9GAMM|nr:hypothetical protein [Halopseudomonas laoshanensis]KAA0696409.1 hypothetical protein DT594_03400 [Halopseudomonas laoshanensis]
MSPLLIGILVAGGVLILLSIGYINHSLERAKLERARLTAELNARLKVCQNTSSQLPGQFMSPELKKLLLSYEAHLLTKLLRVDRKNQRAQQQLDATRNLLAQTDIPVDNAPLKIDNPVTAKEVRSQLENVRQLLTQAHLEGLLDKATLAQWSNQIRQQLIAIALDMFNVVAEQAMRDKKPRVAKLQYERAVTYLNNLNSPAHAQELERYKQLMKMAEIATVRAEQANPDENNELSAGLQELEQSDDSWKKKAVYDD